MPDAAVPEIKFNVAETLHFGGETTVRPTSPEAQKARDKAAELRKERASKPNDGKSFLEAHKNKPSEKNITKQNVEDLNLRFGAGEMKRDPKTGKIEPPPTWESPEAKALYDEAQGEIKAINNVLQYSEITAEAKKTGKSIATILTERAAKGIDGPKTQAEFNVQKDQVLDYIVNTEVIKQGVPEVAAITDPVARRKLIEDTLFADPALGAKIVERMGSIAERVKNLPEFQADADAQKAEKTKIENTTKFTKSLDSVTQGLKDAGVTTADALKPQIEKLIKDGKTVDQALAFLRGEAINVTTIPKLGEIQKYLRARNDYDAARQDLLTISTNKIAKTNPLYIAAAAKFTSVQADINAFETSTDPALARDLAKYNDISKTLSQEKDPSKTFYLSPVVEEISSMQKTQTLIIEADKTISDKAAEIGKQKDAWRSNRLVQESNLISEMKDTIQSSIAEVLSNRYDEMVTLETARMGKVAKEEEEKGNKAVADGIRKVEEAKAKKWIEYDATTRKKDVHSFALGSDIKYAAYAGEDGIKRLILRDSGLSFGLGPGTVSDWKTVDISSLPEEVRKTLDGIYEHQKESYKQKLFGDFFIGKSFANRTVFGKPLGELALKKHEYELLQTKFGESFMSRINSKVEAKAVMEKLKASGIKPTGGLLFLLAMLVGAPILGAKKAITGE